MIFESLFGKQESAGNHWNQINNQGNKSRFQISHQQVAAHQAEVVVGVQ